MNFLAQISILLTVLSFGESADDPGTLLTRKEERSLCRPRISCRGKYGRTVCASDGKNYRGLCELLRARCTTGRNIKFVKYGRCPTCKVKGPVQCFVPACFRPRCPAYPKATCVSFCACQSEYYYKGRKVNCYPTTPTNPCNFKICGNGGICKVVKGKAVCVSQGAVCSLPKVVGTCRARFPRYFFNSVTQQCEHFHYGGCRGNRNRFKTKELCEKACKPDQDVCALPAVQGPCEGHMPRYFHNATSSRCEKFYYGGCGGNKNKFRTIYECKRKCRRSGNPCALVFCGVNGKCKVVNGKPICISSDVCSLPKKVGLCKALIPRYYFNTRTKRCEKFFYGGCGGNGNNFETLSQCNGKCAPKDPCAVVKCEANKECKVILGKARCTPILVNPCIATLCNVGTKCVVVNGKPKCIPVKPTVHPLCAAVLCLKGTCIVRNGRPSCVTSCSSLNRRCPQQGAFCNVSGGICVCRRFCRSRHRPVCGSDGRRYANKCQLDAAACRGRKRIRSVPCYVP